MLTSMQYIGQSHTFVLFPGQTEKVKVGHGEIIEVEDSMVGRLKNADFQIVDAKAPKTPAPAKVAKPKAPKAPKTPKAPK